MTDQIDLFGNEPQISGIDKELEKQLLHGDMVVCSHCAQVCKVYRRGIHAQMVKNLHSIYNARAPIHSREFLHENGGDHGKLRWWGLVLRHNAVDGILWSITEKGIRFLEGRIQVPRRVLAYNNTFLGFEDEADRIYVYDIKKLPFDLYETMSWPGIKEYYE